MHDMVFGRNMSGFGLDTTKGGVVVDVEVLDEYI